MCPVHMADNLATFMCQLSTNSGSHNLLLSKGPVLGIALPLLLLSLSALYRVFTCMSPRKTMSLGDTLLRLLFRFVVNTLYGAYLPRSYVGSDGLLRQHFPENACSA